MPAQSTALRKPPPKQARAAAKRDAILDAAESLILSHTPDALTTRQIADAANVPIGSIYRYFENIDDLLLSLFERINSGTVETLRDSFATASSEWRTNLNRVFDHLAAMHRAHPAYGALMSHIDRQGRDDDEITVLLDSLLTRNSPQLGSLLAQDITRTVIAMMEGVERKLYRLPEERRDGALNQARLAITAYLAHHLDGSD